MSQAFSDWLLNQLWIAYLEARKGKRKTVDEHRFETNDMANVIALRDEIMERRYHPRRGEAFIIYDPVRREIFAAPFPDRVIHHFLYNVSADWWDRRFINDSYSCRVGKGTLYGHQRLAKHIRQVSQNYKEPAFVVKLDIQGYFMSLSHKRLYERVCWGLDRQFKDDKGQLYRTVKYLWREVIFDNPTDKVHIKGKPSDWKDFPRNKSLFCQPKGQGIVIGNLTSQLLSNIYLDQVDRFITMKLGYKHYGRYVDDFYYVVPWSQKDRAIRDIKVIEDYMKSLGLTLHPRKRFMGDSRKGVPFLGVVVYNGYTVPGERVKKKCKAAMVKFACGQDGAKYESVVSYMGHLEHINSKKFLKGLFDYLGWEYHF